VRVVVWVGLARRFDGGSRSRTGGGWVHAGERRQRRSVGVGRSGGGGRGREKGPGKGWRGIDEGRGRGGGGRSGCPPAPRERVRPRHSAGFGDSLGPSSPTLVNILHVACQASDTDNDSLGPLPCTRGPPLPCQCPRQLSRTAQPFSLSLAGASSSTSSSSWSWSWSWSWSSLSPSSSPSPSFRPFPFYPPLRCFTRPFRADSRSDCCAAACATLALALSLGSLLLPRSNALSRSLARPATRSISRPSAQSPFSALAATLSLARTHATR
jgi:hypothetical protein